MSKIIQQMNLKKKMELKMYVCYPCDEMVAWEKSNLCLSHLLMYILIWSQSLSYYPQLIDEYWTVGWALPPSYAPSSPDRLELDGWGTMWAGLDEAVPVWENNPGRYMDLLLRDMGRETPTVVLHVRCLGKEGVQACCKRFHGCAFNGAREEKKLMLLFSCGFL